MNGYQGRHIRADGARKALPMPLDKILLYELVCACLLCAVFCVCVQGNGSKVSMFVCSVGEEK